MTLSSLYLNRNGDYDDGLIHLKGFGQLRTLSLTGTQVSGIGLRCLEDSWNLACLSLRATRVDDAGLDHIRSPCSIGRLKHSRDIRLVRADYPASLMRCLRVEEPKLREPGM